MKARLRELARSLPRPPLGLLLSFGVALALLITLAVLRARVTAERVAAINATFRHYEFDGALAAFLSVMRDAETGQRGFLLTGDRAYLRPYDDALAALPHTLSRLRTLTPGDPAQAERIATLEIIARDKLAELRTTMDVAAYADLPAALERVRTGEGRELMERLHRTADAILGEDDAQAAIRRRVLERRRRIVDRLEITLAVSALGLLVGTFLTLLRQVERTRRAREALRESNGALQLANEELKAFAYSVAHDLRTPLRAINGFAAVLTKDHADGFNVEARGTLDRLAGNGARMSRLIDDLLTLSRVSAVTVEPRRIEMKALVREVCDELLANAGRDGREVEFQVLPDLPPAAGDPSLIRQVWVNLLGNALKFTRDRTPARIEIGGAAAGPEFVTYFVRDNGAGFNMSYLGKLFGPFQRLHRAGEFEGTGIGLALVKRIIQRHGGAVWAEGREGEGALFAFTLPEWVGKG